MPRIKSPARIAFPMVLLPLFAACGVELALPQDVEIECASDGECPNGMQCAPDLLRCVEQGYAPDLIAPVMLEAVAQSDTLVLVFFDEQLDPTTASVPANYLASDGLAIDLATPRADGQSVLLVTGKQQAAHLYSLSVSNIADPIGNVIEPGTAETFLGFGIEPSSEPPRLVSPADGAVYLPSDTPDFAWSRPQGISEFVIQIASDEAFTNVVVEKILADSVYRFNPADLIGATTLTDITYFWRVRTDRSIFSPASFFAVQDPDFLYVDVASAGRGLGNRSDPFVNLNYAVLFASLIADPPRTVRVAGGTYDQEPVNLLRETKIEGGFQPVEPSVGPWVSDPANFPTRLIATPDTTGAVVGVGAHNAELRRLVIYNNEPIDNATGVILSGSNGVLIDQCEIRGGGGLTTIGATGVEMHSCIGVTIRDSTIIGGIGGGATVGVDGHTSHDLTIEGGQIRGSDIGVNVGNEARGVFLSFCYRFNIVGATIWGGQVSDRPWASRGLDLGYSAGNVERNIIYAGNSDDGGVRNAGEATAIYLTAYTPYPDTGYITISNNILVANKGGAGRFANAIKLDLGSPAQCTWDDPATSGVNEFAPRILIANNTILMAPEADGLAVVGIRDATTCVDARNNLIATSSDSAEAYGIIQPSLNMPGWSWVGHEEELGLSHNLIAFPIVPAIKYAAFRSWLWPDIDGDPKHYRNDVAGDGSLDADLDSLDGIDTRYRISPNLGTGNITTTLPLDGIFNDPAAGDYSLAPGSPAIDAGENLTDATQFAVSGDIAGNPRPATGAWSIGAYQ